MSGGASVSEIELKRLRPGDLETSCVYTVSDLDLSKGPVVDRVLIDDTGKPSEVGLVDG